MTKTKKTAKTPTQGAPHDVTTKTPNASSPRPTEVALRPSSPLEIMVSRTIDQELEWYFSYAESALHRERVGMLPSYAALLVTEPTDAAIRNRAREIARLVRACLLAMRPRHVEVLRSVYTPRTWPKNVFAAFESLSAIAVRLAFADDPWPQRSARGGLEHAAAMRLSAALTSASVSPGKLRHNARRLLETAVLAYAGLRALEGSAPEVG
jgi:hypothetical protein